MTGHKEPASPFYTAFITVGTIILIVGALAIIGGLLAQAA